MALSPQMNPYNVALSADHKFTKTCGAIVRADYSSYLNMIHETKSVGKQFYGQYISNQMLHSACLISKQNLHDKRYFKYS